MKKIENKDILEKMYKDKLRGKQEGLEKWQNQTYKK